MSVARWRDVWRRFHGRGTYPHELAFLLRLPVRSLILSPVKLLSCLRLQPNARVLEVGPGPGFFSSHVARSLPAGRLELFDLQREMLQKARSRLQRHRLTNVSCTQGDAAVPPFKREAFDVIFLVAVLGEVSRPDACVESLAHLLRPGGQLSIAELPGDPDALSLAAVQQLAAPHHLQLLEVHPVAKGFVATFQRPARVDAPSGGRN